MVQTSLCEALRDQVRVVVWHFSTPFMKRARNNCHTPECARELPKLVSRGMTVAYCSLTYFKGECISFYVYPSAASSPEIIPPLWRVARSSHTSFSGNKISLNFVSSASCREKKHDKLIPWMYPGRRHFKNTRSARLHLRVFLQLWFSLNNTGFENVSLYF